MSAPETTDDDRPKTKCPHCAEYILEEASVCRFCGREVTRVLQATPKQDERLAQAMLLAPVFASVLIYFWIGSMNLLQGPSSSLAVVGIGTIVITSALAAADANRLGIGAPGDPHKGTSPVGWAAFILLFWIVGYPAYLYRRKTYGAQSYLFVGILVGLLFIVSWFVMGSAIEVRQSEIRGIPGR